MLTTTILNDWQSLCYYQIYRGFPFFPTSFVLSNISVSLCKVCVHLYVLLVACCRHYSQVLIWSLLGSSLFSLAHNINQHTQKKRRLLSLYSIWLSLKIVVQELLNHNNSFERKKRLTSPKIKCIFLLSPFYLFVCVGIWLLPTTTNRKSIVFFAISNLQKILREGMYHFTIVMSLELLKCWNVLFDFCI